MGATIDPNQLTSEANPIRRVLIPISIEALQSILTIHNRMNARCIKGLPKTARFVSAKYNEHSHTIEMVFEDSSFEPFDIAITVGCTYEVIVCDHCSDPTERQSADGA